MERYFQMILIRNKNIKTLVLDKMNITYELLNYNSDALKHNQSLEILS